MLLKKKWIHKLVLVGVLIWGIMLPTMTVKADELSGERSDEQQVLREVDEEGTITEYTGEKGIVEQQKLFRSRSVSSQIVNLNCRGSAVTEYVNVDGSGTGYTNGAYGADAAYLGTTEDGKVKFMLSGVIGLVDASLVQVVNWEDAQSVSYYTVTGGRLVHKITTNLSKSGYGSSLDNGAAPAYLIEGERYYSYDGHYFYKENQYDSMLEDYKKDVRSHAVNPSSPYYNYYQYLPLRSVTKYSADELNSMIAQKAVNANSKMRNIGSCLVENQNLYGVNALLVAGIAANESGWGTSSISQAKNNLFGLRAYDTNPGESADQFASIGECIKEFAEIWMSGQYMNPGNWKYSGAFLGNKSCGFNVRYASDPYWGEKAAALAYALDRYGNYADTNAYTLGVKNEATQVNVRQNPTTQSPILYQTPKTGSITVLIRNTVPNHNFYEIQSDGVLNSNRTALESGTGRYDRDRMYCYISESYVSIISEAKQAYRDVSNEGWYYDAVKYVSQRGIMTGLNSNLFGPAENLSRAQFAVIIWRMAGRETVSYNRRFPDVPEGYWFTDAVLWSANAGIIQGYTDTGMFKPSDAISRQEIATMLYRYVKWKQLNVGQTADLGGFEDSERVAPYAVEAVQWAVETGIIQGMVAGRYLNPEGNASRADCAMMIMRLMEKYSL